MLYCNSQLMRPVVRKCQTARIVAYADPHSDHPRPSAEIRKLNIYEARQPCDHSKDKDGGLRYKDLI